MWKEWGPVAPLWAAAAFCETAAKARGAFPLSYHDLEYRQELIACSRWIADVAVDYRPPGATEPLLREDGIIKLQWSLEARKPKIPPLTMAQQGYAHEYSSDRANW
jgi:hypothetical protein